MKLHHWTAFLDILGFSNAVKKIDNDCDAEKFLKLLEINELLVKNINQEILNHNEQNDPEGFYKYYEAKAAFISDSIVITYSPKKVEYILDESEIYFYSSEAFVTLLRRICNVIYYFSANKFLIRGGISNSYAYVKDRFILGKGIIESHEMEQKAEYPIIALHENIINDKKLFDSITNFLSDQLVSPKEIIVKETSNNLFHFDYLEFLYRTSLFFKRKYSAKEQLRQYGADISQIDIDKSLEIAQLSHVFLVEIIAFFENIISDNHDSPCPNERVQKKYDWLSKYLNERLINYNDLK